MGLLVDRHGAAFVVGLDGLVLWMGFSGQAQAQWGRSGGELLGVTEAMLQLKSPRIMFLCSFARKPGCIQMNARGAAVGAVGVRCLHCPHA